MIDSRSDERRDRVVVSVQFVRSPSAVAPFAVNRSQRCQPSDLLRLNEANAVNRNKRPAWSSASTSSGPAQLVIGPRCPERFDRDA